MKKRKKSSRFHDRINKGENRSCLGIIKASPDPLSDAMLASHEQRGLSEEIKQLKREKAEAEVKAKQQAAEFKDWSEKAEHLLLKCKSEIERLEQGCEDSFNAGRAAGRLEVAQSEEYRAAIRKARLSGAKDCLSSRMFELRWAAKVAEHEVIGFRKCQKQVLKLGGFKKGFNLGLLDSAMDGNLEVAENADGDELVSGCVGEEMVGC